MRGDAGVCSLSLLRREKGRGERRTTCRVTQRHLAQAASQDMKLTVSGEVTEYRGRNYLMLHRWSVVPDAVQPLQ